MRRNDEAISIKTLRTITLAGINGLDCFVPRNDDSYPNDLTPDDSTTNTSLKPNKILFLTLYTFSLTGGIEKVCRAMCRVLSLLQNENKSTSFKALSLHDNNKSDARYISATDFTGFAGAKLRFAFSAVTKGLKSDLVILSHVNLLLFAKIIKTISPKTHIILIAHGIEVWGKLKLWKLRFLQQQVEIWAVSNFTAKNLNEVNAIPKSQIKVLNNCLDPFFVIPENFSKPLNLQKRYGLTKHDKVIFALSRLSYLEQYKGYDKVLEMLKDLPNNIKFILSGKADEEEKRRISKLVEKYSLAERVTVTGFLSEDELTDHYLLADVFVMPSKKEGFGISFIEAAACGCPSIAGNIDGSTDALLHGELGELVNPESVTEIRQAIEKMLHAQTFSSPPLLQKKCIENFGFEQYRGKVSTLLALNEA